MAMDYISSKNICYLVCDILKLLDERHVEHGKRVAYILAKMLECLGGYDEYEIAEYAFLAMVHDIGSFQTKNMPEGGHNDFSPHAVYGYLFLKNTACFGERAQIVLYHHLNYEKMKQVNYEYKNISMMLSMLEEADEMFLDQGEEMNFAYFEKEAGKRFSSESVMLFLKCVRKQQVFSKIISKEYEKELDDIMEYVLFTNEEKERNMRFAMHCMCMKTKRFSAEAVMCVSVTDEIASYLKIPMREREKISYAVMLHDMGMLYVGRDVLEASRKLTDEESTEVRKHVVVAEMILRERFRDQSIVDVAIAHHERLNGSGYPYRKRESEMNLQQCILQVSDIVTAMLNKRKYRAVRTKDEIIKILKMQIEKKVIKKEVANAVIAHYDDIEQKANLEMKEYLEMHIKINEKYKLLMDSEQEKEDEPYI